MEKELTTGIRATASSDQLIQVKKGHPVHRVIVDIYSGQDLLKHYYVWLTDEFTADDMHIEGVPKENDYLLCALQCLIQRFIDSNDEVPKEEGIDCSNERGIVIVHDAQNYIHPIETEV